MSGHGLRVYPMAGSQMAFARVATVLAVVSVGAFAVGRGHWATGHQAVRACERCH
jgi:hypothetical protein